MNRSVVVCLGVLALSSACLPAAWAQQPGREVYRCPGNPVLYTDSLSAKEAQAKGCRTLEGAPITIVQSVKPRSAGGPVPTASGARSGEERVAPGEQRARDTDARRILEDELKREQERLAAMQKDFNNGEPERQGDERNYQKYLDRVAEMRANIARKEADVAAIRRELSKLPQ
ncbi:MAG TPA: hypothetical protein VGP22_18145 [Albitalea sp.]|jgi:hypothetical protein|nr:hypothetical protein [Albitalea sp.]